MNSVSMIFKNSVEWYERLIIIRHRLSCFSIFQLLDKLEYQMEGTTMEGIIPSLYQGQYVVGDIHFLSFFE